MSSPNTVSLFNQVASALMNITRLLPKELVNCTYGIIFDKAQAVCRANTTFGIVSMCVQWTCFSAGTLTCFLAGVDTICKYAVQRDRPESDSPRHGEQQLESGASELRECGALACEGIHGECVCPCFV